MTEKLRKLVTLRTIEDITPIEGADAIETAHIGGWTVVIRKGEFSVGDKAIYFEIDSLLPETQEVFASFASRGVRNQLLDNGETVRGHVVSTARLRGQISQGLVFPLSTFPEVTGGETAEELGELFRTVYGVVKYDPPLPANLAGEVAGYFPTGVVRKTDSERVQNLTDEWLQSVTEYTWVATEKVDGTSATFIKQDGKLRVCSRNLEMKYTPGESDHVYGRIADKFDFVNLLPEGAVLQGEIFGEGIQKNPLKVRGVQLCVFYTVNIDPGTEAAKVIDPMRVPELDIPFPTTVEEAVAQVDGMRSNLNPQVNAEGVVWWNREDVEFNELGGRPNFKAINNKYLLKHGG